MWLGLAALACVASAQGPSDVTLTLAAKRGRTKFQQGEPIELQLRFRASVPGKYGAWDRETYRTARRAEYDRFTAEPAAGTVDPLADSFSEFPGGVYVGPPPAPVKIGSTEVLVDRFLNEWISFRQPGRYRITADTTRLVTIAAPGAGIPMKSSALEIEIVAADPAWAEEQLKQAVARLEIADPPPPRIGQRGPSYQEMVAAMESARNAARSVRFQETPAAARALVRYLGRGPMYAQDQLRAGFFSTPYRKELIAALNEAVEAPDVAIVQDYSIALQEFAELAAFGPLPAATGTTRDEISRWTQDVWTPYHNRATPIADAVREKLSAALANKKGEALAISLAALGGSGQQATSPALAKALLPNFPLLPANLQHQWLTGQWPRIAAPDAEPVLRALASGAGDLRDEALLRLFEFNPAAARVIAVDRIRKADAYRDAYHDDRVLLLLPDKTLPEVDDALAANFERGAYHADLLLARYGSGAIAARVKAFVERADFCNGAIMAFLFRVDPAYARGRRSCSLLDIQGKEDLLMSPGLEEHLILQMSNSPEAGGIANLLQNAGSEAAKPALMEALNRPADPRLPPGAEPPYTGDALRPAGWVPTAEDLDKIRTACHGDGCRRGVDAVRGQLAGPIPISLEVPGPSLTYARVGPFTTRTSQQLREKIAQFPKGATFFMSVAPPFTGSWWAEQRKREIGTMLEDAGMKLVDAPAR